MVIDGISQNLAVSSLDDNNHDQKNEIVTVDDDNIIICCNACNLPPHKNKKLLCCSRCKQVWYHNQICQKKDYKQHKLQCYQLSISCSFVKVIDLGSKNVLGRVAHATKDINVGEFVLKEIPAIIFDDSNGYFNLWDSYLDTTSSLQKTNILQMQSSTTTTVSDGSNQEQQQEQESSTTTTTRMIATELKRYYESHSVDRNAKLDKQLATTLVTIANINSHSFFPEDTSLATYDSSSSNTTEDGRAGMTMMSQQQKMKSAFYIIGSKIEHSCAPNLSFDTNKYGMLECLAEIPIQQYDRLSISYQNCVYEESRNQRRIGLFQTKQFICNCLRCLGPDECNPLHCTNCNNNNNNNNDEEKPGTLFQWGSDNDETIWKCLACNWKGKQDDTIVRQINQINMLSEKLDSMKHRLETSGFHPKMVKECLIIQNLIATKLSPLHWLHPKVWHSIRVVATSTARMLMKNQHRPTTDPSVKAMIQLSGICQLEHYLWIKRCMMIVHGELDLKNLVVCNDDDDDDQTSSRRRTSSKILKQPELLNEQLFEKQSNIETLLDVILSMEHDSTTFDINTRLAPMIFHAGIDLLVIGHNERISKLFEKCHLLFQHWKSLSDENRSMIQCLVTSKGTNNPFPNHIVA